MGTGANRVKENTMKIKTHVKAGLKDIYAPYPGGGCRGV
jgi:hypothetical protein